MDGVWDGVKVGGEDDDVDCGIDGGVDGGKTVILGWMVKTVIRFSYIFSLSWKTNFDLMN